jgi:hypothetical protein
MEAVMADASSTATSVMMIIVFAFVVGHVGVGVYVKRGRDRENCVLIGDSDRAGGSSSADFI